MASKVVLGVGVVAAEVRWYGKHQSPGTLCCPAPSRLGYRRRWCAGRAWPGPARRPGACTVSAGL